MMVVRLERNVCGTASRPITGLSQCDNLSVNNIVFDVSSFSGHFSALIDDHTTYERIWRDKADAPTGQFDRPGSVSDVSFSVLGQLLLRFQTSFQFYENKPFT